jgi:hypothetical protein
VELLPEDGAVKARGKGIVKALRRIGDETGAPVTMDTKDARIRLQKIVYLLKTAGYEPARKFEFNLYQNGPYSPGLTEVYFAYGNEGIAEAQPATDVTPAVLDMIRDADSRGTQFLEALATALDTAASLRREGRPGNGLAPGLQWARSIKPQIDEPIWREVREFLRAHPALADFT